MKKIILYLLTTVIFLTAMCGCSKNTEQENLSKNIPFEGNQLYALAYIGYDNLDGLDFYKEKYLPSSDIPVHYFSKGEYYLIIPRYGNMHLELYADDMETMAQTLVYKTENAQPFLIQCNISDIFPDVTVKLTYNGESAEFSPYISLKDGSVMQGEKGLNITQAQDK